MNSKNQSDPGIGDAKEITLTQALFITAGLLLTVCVAAAAVLNVFFN